MYDQVLINGNIITMDKALSKKKWVAVKDGKIAALGDDAAPKEYAKEVIDLKGATVLPGLFDCHNHVLLAGIWLNGVDLADAPDIKTVLERLEKACKEQPMEDYVYGINYIPQNIKENRYPTSDELDAISNGHVVAIFAATLHGCGCNSKAMELAQVPEDLPGVERVNGKVSGVYTSDESSFLATSNLIGSVDDETLWKYVEDCATFGASKGLTSIHGLFGQFVKNDRDMDLMLEKGKELPIDITPFYQTWDVDKAKNMGLERVGGCLTLDGAAFEYTMANFEPYVTAPALRGVLYHNDDEVYRVVKNAHKYNMQCSMHAVGERAIDQLLYTYHRVFLEDGRKDIRHRIEHFCLPTAKQVKMAKDLGLILSIQPGFTYLWDQELLAILGREREDRMDNFRILKEAGNLVCGGSDCPVTPIEPLMDIAHCANGADPVRNIPMTEALKMFTTDAAYAIYKEDTKGSIEIGKDGDFTIIDRDPYEYENDKALFDMEVVMTISRGTIIYKA